MFSSLTKPHSVYDDTFLTAIFDSNLPPTSSGCSSLRHELVAPPGWMRESVVNNKDLSVTPVIYSVQRQQFQQHSHHLHHGSRSQDGKLEPRLYLIWKQSKE
jgi:hypothetical protein